MRNLFKGTSICCQVVRRTKQVTPISPGSEKSLAVCRFINSIFISYQLGKRCRLQLAGDCQQIRFVSALSSSRGCSSVLYKHWF